MMPAELQNLLNAGESDSTEFVSSANVERVAKAVCSLLRGLLRIFDAEHLSLIIDADDDTTAVRVEQ